MLTGTNTFDNLTRLTGVVATPSAGATVSFAYQYNLANERTQITQPDGGAWAYGYDALGQVTSREEHWSDGTAEAGDQFSYTFDTIGNRTASPADGAAGANLPTTAYALNALNEYASRTVPGGADVVGALPSGATARLILVMLLLPFEREAKLDGPILGRGLE